MLRSSPSPVTELKFDWETWRRPPAWYSQCPFWFWNDALDEKEIIRQLEEFQRKGVDAFVLHPRIGLPRSCGWLSEELFYHMRVALRAARERGMWAMLYDEGMYPSGSASGLVVATNPKFQTRGLVWEPVGTLGANDQDRILVAEVARVSGERVAVYEQKIDAVVRGLHYIGDEADPSALGEEEPPAADLLNPEAVQCFLRLVYDRFAAELGEFFGDTVKAIFTDEPQPLSRSRDPECRPGGKETLRWVNEYLGYDFTPHLAALWFDDEEDAGRHRNAYREAIAARLNQTYFQPLSDWCQCHGMMLAGHPAEPDDFGNLRHFHIPGQDMVWRDVEPDKPSSLEGAPSTMAKAAASMAFHRGRERNLNEFAGAYGEELTFEELRWLASWVLIRGCDLLVPHAFYYSFRGPRRHERPPDVGFRSAWWESYLPWAEQTRRLCWLNANFVPCCGVAILGMPARLPWKAAKVLLENQIDFHYVEPIDLESATVSDGLMQVGPGCYHTLVVEPGFDAPIPAGFPVLAWDEHALGEIKQRTSAVVTFAEPAPSLRVRHLQGEGWDMVLIFNEEKDAVCRKIQFPSPKGDIVRLDLESGGSRPCTPEAELRLPGHGWAAFLLGQGDSLAGLPC
jgi:hypothetical protein